MRFPFSVNEPAMDSRFLSFQGRTLHLMDDWSNQSSAGKRDEGWPGS
jgi:hypothetical protein